MSLFFFLISLSCTQRDREPKQHKIITQTNSVITKKQKHAQIEALFSKHDGYDHLNITYFEEDNYIQIAATTNSMCLLNLNILKNYFSEKIPPISINFYWVKVKKKYIK